jgi:hypothetical protein
MDTVFPLTLAGSHAKDRRSGIGDNALGVAGLFGLV